MVLDLNTLLVMNVVNVMALSLTLVVIMGKSRNPAAAAGRRSLVAQALAWAALIISSKWQGMWQDWLLSVLAMMALSASQWFIFQALQGWLGPRPFRRTLGVLCVLMPLGYALTFNSYPVRVGWANLLLAAQIFITARATLTPKSQLGGRWRWVLFGCFVVMGCFTVTRGVLGAWFTEMYPNFRYPSTVNMSAMLAANVTLVLSTVAILVAWREEAEWQLRLDATTDQLTGVLNRYGWAERASSMILQAQRHGVPISLLALDLDHFKQINDSRGHDAGDAALRLFGRMLTRSQRGGDLIARLGGEEFAVLLPFSDENSAKGFDQRLRLSLGQAASIELGHELNFSSGLAVQADRAETVEQLLQRADAALYRAKQEGRGRLVVSGTASA